MNAISMTELQKLSLKKLRKMKLPLYVLDRKSRKHKIGGFVIESLAAHEERIGEQKPKEKSVPKNSTPLDYRTMGLLWDHPSMSNEEFHKALKDPSSGDHPWVARRFLERAPSRKVKEILSLEELKGILSRIKIRPVFQEAWSRAIHYWAQTA